MKTTTTRANWIPKESKKTTFEDLKIEVYQYENQGRPALMIFEGRRQKPSFHKWFANQEDRQTRILGFVNKRQQYYTDETNRKLEQKAKQDQAFKDIKVGDVFCSSWGYSMTIVDFYQLVELKGKTGTFRSIGDEVTEGSAGYTGRVKPTLGDFCGNSFKARILGDSFKASSSRAYKTNPENSHYFNRMD